MLKYSHGRLFAKALVASAVLNVLMIAAGISGGAQGRHTLFDRLSTLLPRLLALSSLTVVPRTHIPPEHSFCPLLRRLESRFSSTALLRGSFWSFLAGERDYLADTPN